MFITNFSLDLNSQMVSIIFLTIGIILILILFCLFSIQKIDDRIQFVISNGIIPMIALIIYIFFALPSALKPNEYKLTIAYVNVDDNNNKTMTKDVAINTLLNDGIYPKYNLKYKTEKETFKITKEEYEKLSEIYYDDLNNRR